MQARRNLLKLGASSLGGLMFCSCGLQHAANAQIAPRHLVAEVGPAKW